MEKLDGLKASSNKSPLIEDPAAELSVVIRKNVERADMESYLKGIRYVLNGNGSK